jgi:hypothetical protein
METFGVGAGTGRLAGFALGVGFDAPLLPSVVFAALAGFALGVRFSGPAGAGEGAERETASSSRGRVPSRPEADRAEAEVVLLAPTARTGIASASPSSVSLSLADSSNSSSSVIEPGQTNKQIQRKVRSEKQLDIS